MFGLDAINVYVSANCHETEVHLCSGDGVAKTLQLLLSNSQGCPICTASKKNEAARVF
jgi:hypothetical protein